MEQLQAISMKRLQIKRVYNRKDTLKRDWRATVQIEILKDRERKSFDTGVQLRPDQWNKAKGKPDTEDKDRAVNFAKIEQIETSLKTI